MPEILEGEEKITEPVTETKPTLIQRVKQWPVSIALATGIALGGAGTYEMTADKYSPDAVIEQATDSLDVSRGVVIRPVAAFDTVGMFKTGDEVRMLVFINGVVCYEQKQTITQAPVAPNDGFAATFRVYIHEDRIAPLPKDTTIKETE